MNIIKNILPHIIIILSGIFIIFLILDNYNPTMNFINNTVSIKLFWIFCLLSIINSILAIATNRKIFK
ncbi:hypothetical protein QA584_05385 [Anaerocolumna sp. AGMB13025]|uniref:hypothetical protein n=1 Tax=Anaerocolumna sp. AGMB13025 TaxID=3039116 RepID=UPI00241F6D38|nr:hypothetical protein [Anaerocolumna sp. AGMB13025]WFR58505.1 hypothetical protein QA584_05385 [Anaerocolumna sp. AGMB13025]